MPARAPTSSPATPAPSAAECRLIGPGDQQLDTRPDQAVARRAASEWSVLSVDELYACGTGSARSHQGITVHRTRCLDARDRRHHRGIPVTSPARTLLELAGTRISDDRLRRAVREALALKRVTTPQLVEILTG